MIKYKGEIFATSNEYSQITNTVNVVGNYVVDNVTKSATGTANNALDFVNTVLSKSCNKTEAEVGDTLVYTITFTNNSTLTLNLVTITDTLPDNVTYESSSLTTSPASTSGSLTSGLVFENIAANDTITIIFDVIISTEGTGDVTNNVSAVSAFTDNSGANQTITVDASPVVTPLSSTLLIVTKSSSTAYVTENDQEVEYTITVENAGTKEVTDLVITDILPTGLTLVSGSITINGTASTDDPNTGITISSLAVGATCTVTFKVTVTM